MELALEDGNGDKNGGVEYSPVRTACLFSVHPIPLLAIKKAHEDDQRRPDKIKQIVQRVMELYSALAKSSKGTCHTTQLEEILLAAAAVLLLKPVALDSFQSSLNLRVNSQTSS